MDKEDMIRQMVDEMRTAGVLSRDKCDFYMKDISTTVLAFILKIKQKMITSEMSFFSDYYLPSNVKMINFSEEEARYVFKTCMACFARFFVLALMLDELRMVRLRVDDDIHIYFVEE